MTQLLRLAALLLLSVGSCAPVPSAMEGVPPPITRVAIEPWALETLKASVVAVMLPKGGHGSAVCIGRIGEKSYYVTAAHVVDDLQPREEVKLIGILPEGGHLEASAVVVKIGDAKALDLALLEGGRSAFPITKISKKSDLDWLPGETLYAVGYPLSIFPAQVTIGYFIRSHGLHYDHSAAMWFGNSGGPLVDTSLEVVGINVLLGGCEGGPHSDMGRSIRLSFLRSFVKEYGL